MADGTDGLLCTALGRQRGPFKPEVVEIPSMEPLYHHFVA